MSAQLLRWGILGTASIAVRRMIPALHASLKCEPVAIASRDPAQATRVADANGVPRAFGSYQELLDDPGVDAVYIPLPNHLHVPWSIKALEHGKHVLCEKPIGLGAPEAGQLLAAAARSPHLKVMEGFMYRCHPRWQLVRRIVADGEIGALGSVHTIFSYDNRDPDDIRNIRSAGGGGWLDIGCYGVSVARFLFGAEPADVMAHQEVDPDFQVDRLTSAVLAFEHGAATVTCSTQLVHHQHVSILGSRGRIELVLPFNPPNDRPTTINLHGEGIAREITVNACDQFRLQADRFADAVMRGADLPITLEDSLANMRVLDRAVQSSARG